MPVTSNSTFVYGTFRESPPTSRMTPPPKLADIAIEILREFSASELVGKVYIKVKGVDWMPVSQQGVRDYTWYKEYQSGRGLEFLTDGPEPWEVLYFRSESDAVGPYVAVGLRLSHRG